MLGSRRRAGKDVERLLRDGVDPPGDARLLERFRAERDESAFALIVERHGPLVLALCRRHLREPADVDDAFQATFLVLARKGGDLRDGDALASWLYGVARRVASRARSDVLKRRAREAGTDRLDEIAAAPERPPNDALEDLDRELSRLPEKYRAPLVLCHLEGKTYDQAAVELGWPPGTVRGRMARGRELLRARLSRRGIDAPACLAALRVDVASTLPSAALVAETTAAAGRFIGLAKLAFLAAQTRWPAASLAQGVIMTMYFSPWKLVGVGLASAVLSAGALAVASATFEPAARQEPPKPESPPSAAAEERPGPVPVGRRLDDLEAKIDRVAAMLANQPAATLRSSPDRGLERSGMDRSTLDARGLREIEAQLINAHEDYRRTQALFNRNVGVVAKGDMEGAAKPVRVLLARLLDMRDEIKAQRRSEVLPSLARASRNDRAADPSRPSAEAAVERERLQSELMMLDDRLEKVERLIAWTREQFPDVKLTILDEGPKESE